MRPRSTVLASLLCLLAIGPATVVAQGTDGGARHGDPLLTGRDALLGLAIAGASIGVMQADRHIAERFQDSSVQRNRSYKNLASTFTNVNETTLTLSGLALWGVGRLSHQRTLADVSWHVAESVASASIFCQLIRGPLGRARPSTSNAQDPFEFHAFKGFSEFKYRAFPSIHTSSSFAAASALVAEVHHRRPGATWYVAPVAYGLAIMPGLSRMFLNQHWASDVFSGALVGTFAGYRAVNYSHAHPDNRIDRFMLGTTVGAAPGGGMEIGMSRTF
ncbi:MAG: phosphatase PAP2 family protein [Gemmatimonadaceae bacterium]